MRLRSRLPALVVYLMVGVVALSGQIRGQVAGSSDQDRADRESGVIRGTVLAADGESRLAKATVLLRKSGSRRGAGERTARSDGRGQYEFKDLEAGKYLLSVTRNGFLPQNYGQKRVPAFRGQRGGTPLTLGDGQVLSGIDFNLIRGGVVEGRVADQDYEPLSRVIVTLSGYHTVQGERELTPVSRAQTDDRGQFRLFDIPPGSYFLSATQGGGRPFFGRRGRRGQSFPPTYYPGVPSPEQATKIEVSAGGEVGGFHLTLIEAYTYSVSGRVLASDGSLAQSVRIMTVNRSSPGQVSVRGGATTDLQGTFRVDGLLPGRYRLIAGRGRGQEPQIASASVEVIDRDIQGLTLALGSGASITGRIVSENQESTLNWRRISVVTRPAEGGGRGFGFGGRGRPGGGGRPIEEDFSFRISNLPGGLYRLSVNLPPGNHYVESIRAQGQDIVGRLIELNDHDQLSGVEVRVSPNGSRISGRVESEEDGRAVDGATVLVFAADPQQRGSFSRFTRTTQTDQAGRYSLEGLAPAEYLVCALVEHEPGRESEPEYLNFLEGDSTSIDLSAGETSSKTLVALEAPATN